MTYTSFCHALIQLMESSPTITLAPGSKLVIMSDLHAGDGSRKDDLSNNGPLILSMLERHYLAGGYTLVLNGDIEELQKYPLPSVRRAWAPLYSVLDRFSDSGRLYKIVGNHDEALRGEAGYPYPLHEGLRILVGAHEMYVFHGHQASHFYSRYNHVSGALVKYIVRTTGIHSLNVSRNSYRRFKVERRIYRFCQDYKRVAIIGHTHRPLFESLSKYDRLRFAIEGLCREYSYADEAIRSEIKAALSDYKEEFTRLRLRERWHSPGLGLYGDDILMPCLFNSGSAVGRKGVTALEIENGSIQLVYWFEPGKTRRYLKRELDRAKPLDGTPYYRAALSTDKLDYLLSRIELLA